MKRKVGLSIIAFCLLLNIFDKSTVYGMENVNERIVYNNEKFGDLVDTSTCETNKSELEDISCDENETEDIGDKITSEEESDVVEGKTGDNEVFVTDIDCGDYENEINEIKDIGDEITSEEEGDVVEGKTDDNEVFVTDIDGGDYENEINETEDISDKITSEEEGDVVERETDKEILVDDIDLGDYENEMVVGDKQLLTITLLPNNCIEESIYYKSSNEDVATINGMGRIIALKEGNSVISVWCNGIEQSFNLKVKHEESDFVHVEDIDVGDCPSEIEQGTSQMISPLVIPSNASCTKFSFASSNSDIVTVNALGRITGLRLGVANITVTCENKSRTFEVKVVENVSKKIIAIKDIDVNAEFKIIYVGGVGNISATIKPEDANSGKITFSSSNESIATVNSSGVVRGLAEGDVIITVKADKIVKEVPVKVKLMNVGMLLNSDYVALSIDEKFQIDAKVIPENAQTCLLYKSLDSSIASVSNSGLVTAKNVGNTAIIVANGDNQAALSVFVHEDMDISSIDGNVDADATNVEMKFSNKISAFENELITDEMLRYYYKNKEYVVITGEKYQIMLDGSNIVNIHNPLYTDIALVKNDIGFQFTINNKQELCGKITLRFNQDLGKYLYLYNDEKKVYEQLEFMSLDNIIIDTAGIYLITEERIQESSIQIKVLIIIGCLFIGSFICYLLNKHRYIFW